MHHGLDVGARRVHSRVDDVRGQVVRRAADVFRPHLRSGVRGQGSGVRGHGSGCGVKLVGRVSQYRVSSKECSEVFPGQSIQCRVSIAE